MSRAGYADFFPAAPSVLAKKAQAAKAAKEKVRIQQHDDYDRDRDISGALSAGSTASSTTSIPTTAHSNSQLTPATSSSSPPDVSPQPATTSPNAEVLTAEKEKKALPSLVEQLQPAIPTPKATPPAPQRRNCRVEYDPFLDEGPSAKRGGKVTYRYDGEGLHTPVQDPRKSYPDYTQGPNDGKRQVRTALGRVNWEWDRHYIGPGPPAQIMVTGLSPLTTESEILMNFRTFGDVQKFELKVDPTTGGSLGICSIIYRDGKGEKVLGHHSARSAVQKGNQMKIGLQNIKVVLDRDGMKCAKHVERIMEEKRKKQAEARRKELEIRRREGVAKRRVEEVKRREEARNRPPPSLPLPPAGEREQRLLAAPTNPDVRFVQSRPPNYRAIDELGQRPAIFISSRYIPGENRFCKHLHGRLKNFGVEDVLCDKNGFFVVFYDLKGLESCFRVCDGDRLFSYQMRMQKYPKGNPNALAVPTHHTSRSTSPEPAQSKKKLERLRLLCESNAAAKMDLKATLASDIRSRIAEPHIYDLLAPGRLEVRKKPEGSDSGTVMDTASTPTCDSPLPPLFVAATFPEVQPLPANLIAKLPRFKKHKPKRPETPTSDAAHLSKGLRSKRNEEARPLAHRLNHYDGSDDESTTTDQRPVSRGSVSRAFSTDIGDDDSVSLAPSSLDIRTRKRKRSIGARTPSRLKDAAISTDDEDDEAVETTSPGQEADLMEVDEPDEPDELCPHDFIADVDSEEHASRKKLRKVEAAKLASDGLGQREILDEDEGVDIASLDDSKETDLCQRLSDEKTEAAIDLFLDQIEAEKDGPPPVVDMSWSISSTDLPRVTLEEDTDMIMDLDGLQAVIMDDEDLRLLKSALEDTPPAGVGNVYLWACKMRECKVANREGKRGVTYAVETIEGFYRPNHTGCARTEGYRKIPEAEKSKYLPHRLAVAAKRANAASQVSSQNPSKTAATRVPVSSSRENRVNNRRLVQELNNQKQILCGDADIMRFNQLKKRKKPVRFARSAIHNWGLYAMENIPANDMIIEYVGEIVRQQVADMRERKYIKSGIGSSYLFRIDENTVIDATKKGGIARFINHSCTPNCTAKIIKVEGTKRIVIYALRDIQENEELTYDYKFERELDSDDRIPCLCGSSGCKGFLN